MLEIHEFWTELFPMFKDSYEFIYVFFDVSTILIFIKLILAIPSKLLLESKGEWKW